MPTWEIVQKNNEEYPIYNKEICSITITNPFLQGVKKMTLSISLWAQFMFGSEELNHILSKELTAWYSNLNPNPFYLVSLK